MAKIHTLDFNKYDGQTRFVIHVAAPEGKNNTGFTWKEIFLAAGISGRTSLTVGTGPGQIDAIEKAGIDAGDIIELDFRFPATSDDIPKAQTIYDNMITDKLGELMAQFGYYGLTLDW